MERSATLSSVALLSVLGSEKDSYVLRVSDISLC